MTDRSYDDYHVDLPLETAMALVAGLVSGMDAKELSIAEALVTRRAAGRFDVRIRLVVGNPDEAE